MQKKEKKKLPRTNIKRQIYIKRKCLKIKCVCALHANQKESNCSSLCVLVCAKSNYATFAVCFCLFSRSRFLNFFRRRSFAFISFLIIRYVFLKSWIFFSRTLMRCVHGMFESTCN